MKYGGSESCELLGFFNMIWLWFDGRVWLGWGWFNLRGKVVRDVEICLFRNNLENF